MFFNFFFGNKICKHLNYNMLLLFNNMVEKYNNIVREIFDH